MSRHLYQPKVSGQTGLVIQNVISGVKRKWLIVFVVAAVVRGLLFLQVLDRPDVVFQPDSRMYAELAEGIRQHGSLVYPDRPGRPDMERMPGYPLFLAFLLTVFSGSFLGVVAVQALLDSVSCVLVGMLGERVRAGVGLLAGLLAALNLNMVTYSLFVLNDSLFLLIFLAGTLLFLRFMEQPAWRMGAAAGVLLGLATLVRPVLFYFPLFLVPFLWAYLVWGKRVSPVRSIGHVLVLAAAFAVLVVPWLARNQALGGRFQLTAQAGEHLSQYVVPFVWQYSKGIPFIEGMKTMNRDMALEAEKEGLDWNSLGPFEQSDRRVAMAIRILKEEPVGAIAKAWAFGMVKNLFAPALVDLSYLLSVERPHFFYTEGKTLLDRGVNFIRGMKGWFAWAMLLGLVLMPVLRLVQAWGLVAVLRERGKGWTSLLLVLIIGYFLLVSGPVGYAKYRMPFEPVLIVLLAVGLKEIAVRFPITRLRRSPSAKVEG